MTSLGVQQARLKRAIARKRFPVSVTTSPRDVDGKLVLVFPDGRQAFGNYDDLRFNIEHATSVELLMATCDLDDQLSD